MTRQVICFDATGTLIEISEPVGTVYARVASEFGVDLPGWRLDDAFQRVLRHAPPRGLHIDGQTPDERRQAEFDWWSERIRQTFQATDSTARFADFPAFAQALFDTYRSPECWCVRTAVRETLTEVGRMGFERVVVSNFDHRLMEILESLELLHFFRHVYVPSETGARKPDRAVFDLVAEQLGIPLSDQIYVGDDSAETLSAIAAHGLEVIDVRTLSDFGALTEELAGAAIVSAHSPDDPASSSN